MKNFSRLFGIIAFTAVIVFGLSSCATYKYERSNPFQTGANSNRPIIRMANDGVIMFDNKLGDSLKVNGVAIPSNEFTLPAAASYEVKFRTKIRQTFAFAPNINFIGRATVTYNFVPGKTYYMQIKQDDANRAASLLLGVTVSSGMEIAIYDTEKLTNSALMNNKVGTFPVSEIGERDF